MCVACDRCENPEAFPPFLALERLLATDIGELGIMVGADMEGEIADDITKSIVEDAVMFASAMGRPTPSRISR